MKKLSEKQKRILMSMENDIEKALHKGFLSEEAKSKGFVGPGYGLSYSDSGLKEYDKALWISQNSEWVGEIFYGSREGYRIDCLHEDYVDIFKIVKKELMKEEFRKTL